MQRCPVCNGRTIQGESGYRCMNSSCAGATPQAQQEGMICRCGEVMSYQGEDSWGQPNYLCLSCRATKRIER